NSVQTKSPAHAPGLPLFELLASSIVDGFLHRIFQAADGVPHLAGHLVCLTFGFEFAVARDLAGDFLDLAFDLLGRAFDTILVHLFSFHYVSNDRDDNERMPANVPVTRLRNEILARATANPAPDRSGTGLRVTLRRLLLRTGRAALRIWRAGLILCLGVLLAGREAGVFAVHRAARCFDAIFAGAGSLLGGSRHPAAGARRLRRGRHLRAGNRHAGD